MNFQERVLRESHAKLCREYAEKAGRDDSSEDDRKEAKRIDEWFRKKYHARWQQFVKQEIER